MQGAKTSNIMLACWRRVHLHKSASFKRIFEQIQTNQKRDTNFNSTMIVKSNFKLLMRKSIENITPQIRKTFRFGALILKPVAWFCSRGSAFYFRLVFWTLWGVPPWTDLGLLGDPLVRNSGFVGTRKHLFSMGMWIIVSLRLNRLQLAKPDTPLWFIVSISNYSLFSRTSG